MRTPGFPTTLIMDLYLVRPLSSGHKVWESRFNSWGNVRIASAPRQLNTPFVDLVKGLLVAGDPNNPINTNVNELALGAEFQTGLEYNFTPRWNGKTLGVIGFFGANASFEAPDKHIQIFEVPGRDSPQRGRFQATFGSAANSTYIGFVTPDRDRFYRQWGFGFRYSKFQPDAAYQAPQTYSVTLGQDELITGGGLNAKVLRVDGFWPLPLKKENGKWQFLYVFGTSTMRLSRSENRDPFILNPGPASIKGYENSVAIVSTPSTRDTYRLGIGVDLVNLLRSAISPAR